MASSPPAPPRAPPRRPGLSLGYQHGCLLDPAGEVRCWGRDGQLGAGTARSGIAPVTIASGVRQLVTREGRRCAIADDGEVRCWGGPLGKTPQAIPELGPAVDVAIGLDAICVVAPSGGVRCRDQYGQVANVTGLAKIRAVAQGSAL